MRNLQSARPQYDHRHLSLLVDQTKTPLTCKKHTPYGRTFLRSCCTFFVRFFWAIGRSRSNEAYSGSPETSASNSVPLIVLSPKQPVRCTTFTRRQHTLGWGLTRGLMVCSSASPRGSNTLPPASVDTPTIPSTELIEREVVDAAACRGRWPGKRGEGRNEQGAGLHRRTERKKHKI